MGVRAPEVTNVRFLDVDRFEITRARLLPPGMVGGSTIVSTLPQTTSSLNAAHVSSGPPLARLGSTTVLVDSLSGPTMP